MRTKRSCKRADKVRVEVVLPSQTVSRVMELAKRRSEEPGLIIDLAVALLWVALAKPEVPNVKPETGSPCGPLPVDDVLRKLKRRAKYGDQK